jgi:hypothetical protein
MPAPRRARGHDGSMVAPSSAYRKGWENSPSSNE